MGNRYSIHGEVKQVLNVEENPEVDDRGDSVDEFTVTLKVTVETEYMADGLRFMAEDRQRFILVTD
jgi:nicotinamide riboside kinase